MADIHTLALVCPAAGQTLLAEALLAQAGVIGAAGSIEHGGAVSKYNALERTAGQSLSACRH